MRLRDVCTAVETASKAAEDGSAASRDKADPAYRYVVNVWPEKTEPQGAMVTDTASDDQMMSLCSTLDPR